MSEDEFEIYIMNSILPFFPDAREISGKRVLLKINVVPGQTNDNLLVKLKSRGFYFLPSVPDATHMMHVWLGEFKRVFYNNLNFVTSSYHTHNKAIGVGGGRIYYLEPDLDHGRWMNVGSLERMIGAFEKVGLCPFTKQYLQDKNMCATRSS
jgi:hypothetical protein